MNTRPNPLSLILFFAIPFANAAEPAVELIFQDDFERSESQEEKDEPGNGWGTNSEKRAKGKKQVDLRDGAMHIYIHKEADHAVSVTHPAEFKDGIVRLRFMLENKDDSLGLNFADLKYKKVWAGHLFIARVGTKFVQLSDLKTGVMDLGTRTLKLEGKLTPEMQKGLKAKQKWKKQELETGKWYGLEVKVVGDTLSVAIEGTEVASLSSEGIAHPTKRTLRLSVPQKAVIDDLKIWRLE